MSSGLDFNSILSAYGYAGVFVALVLDFFGFAFLPSEPMLLLAAGLVGTGDLKLLPLIAVGIAGTFVGYGLAFELSRRVGFERLVAWGRRVGIKEHHWETSQRLWQRYGAILLIAGRYVAGLRHVVPYLAGLSGMPARAFHIWNVIGSCLWVVPLVLVGRSLGPYFDDAWRWFERLPPWVIAAVAAAVVALAVWWWLRRARGKKR
ncbi:MAG TPA: DedA family protein [Limnochordia bacterium]|nr:DedA family protein [Limnochordia bacterium]